MKWIQNIYLHMQINSEIRLAQCVYEVMYRKIWGKQSIDAEFKFNGTKKKKMFSTDRYCLNALR